MTNWIVTVASGAARFACKLAQVIHRRQPFPCMTSADLRWAGYPWLPRLLLSGILAVMLSPAPGRAQAPQHDSNRGVLYASAGPQLTQYKVDAEGASLVRRNSIRLPANVQYAWPHPSRKYFYVAWSDGGASTAAPGAATVPSGKLHGVSAFRIDPGSGALQPIGQPVSVGGAPDSSEYRYYRRAYTDRLQRSKWGYGASIERRRWHDWRVGENPAPPSWIRESTHTRCVWMLRTGLRFW